MLAREHVVYATSDWGINDERRLTVLTEQGLTPHVISLGRDVANALELRDAVLTAAGPGSIPLFAGPFHNALGHWRTFHYA